MHELTIILLTAGRSTRFGRPKQLEPVGPASETIPELTLQDAFASGCTRAIIISAPEHEQHFRKFSDRDGRIDVHCQEQAWGTAHAAWIGMEHCTGPVIIANGDDLYGLRSMGLACSHALLPQSTDHAAIAFPLGHTLSANGPVNRAICQLADHGTLRSTAEVTGLSRSSEGTIHDADGASWPEHALASMNLWVMRPAMKPYFMEALEQRPIHAECGLPTVVLAAIGAGERFRCITTPDRWMGLTFAADADLVRAQLLRGHVT